MGRWLAGWLAGLVVVAPLGGLVARAQQPVDPDAKPANEVEASVAVDVLSHFVWRGMRVSRGAVIEPSIDLEHRGILFNLWANFDGHEYPPESGNRGGRFTEVDLTLSYSRPLGRVDVSGGLIYYGQRDLPDTAELFVTAGAECALNPSVGFYYDVGSGHGGFLILSAGHAVDLGRDISLQLGGTASYNLKNANMGPGTTGGAFAGPYHAEVGASVDIPVTRTWKLSPRVAYSFALSENARAALDATSYDGGTHRLWSGGVALSRSF